MDFDREPDIDPLLTPKPRIHTTARSPVGEPLVDAGQHKQPVDKERVRSETSAKAVAQGIHQIDDIITAFGGR